MGKRSAVVELFLGDMGSIQRELRPSIQREDQPTMETKLEQITVKAVNQLPTSVVRENRTPRCVSSQDWCVQQEINLPEQKSAAP